MLGWNGTDFDLAETVVRHRDDGGRIAFSLTRAVDAAIVGYAEYSRVNRTWADRVLDFVDFANDEPWTWEDGDFGLYVFHEATGTGPIKFRDDGPAREEDEDDDSFELQHLTVDDDGAARVRAGGRTERIRFEELTEVRAKFELAGIWADAALLTLDSPTDLLVVALGSTAGVDAARLRLLPRLRRLPGWGRRSDRAFADACEYALRDRVGPTLFERAATRAERPVWRRRD